MVVSQNTKKRESHPPRCDNTQHAIWVVMHPTREQIFEKLEINNLYPLNSQGTQPLLANSPSMCCLSAVVVEPFARWNIHTESAFNNRHLISQSSGRVWLAGHLVRSITTGISLVYKHLAIQQMYASRLCTPHPDEFLVSQTLGSYTYFANKVRLMKHYAIHLHVYLRLVVYVINWHPLRY